MKIRRLEEYMREEEIDFNIDKAHLNECLIKIPKLHSKWMKFFFREQGKFFLLEDERKKLFRQKHKYYLTEYELEIKPNQLIWYIESDKEYSKLLLKINVQKSIVDYLEKIVKKTKDQNFIIKNIIEWERYIHGDNI